MGREAVAPLSCAPRAQLRLYHAKTNGFGRKGCRPGTPQAKRGRPHNWGWSKPLSNMAKSGKEIPLAPTTFSRDFLAVQLREWQHEQMPNTLELYRYVASLPGKMATGAIEMGGIAATLYPEGLRRVFAGLLSPEQLRFWGIVAVVLCLTYWVVLLLLKPKAMPTGAVGDQATTMGSHSAAFAGNHIHNLVQNFHAPPPAVEPPPEPSPPELTGHRTHRATQRGHAGAGGLVEQGETVPAGIPVSETWMEPIANPTSQFAAALQEQRLGPAYKQAVLQLERIRGEITDTRADCVMTFLAKAPLKECRVEILDIIGDGEPTPPDLFLRTKPNTDGNALSTFQFVSTSERARFLFARQDLTDPITNPPWKLFTNQGPRSLLDGVDYQVRLALRSEAPHPTFVTLGLRPERKRSLNAKILHQGVERSA